MADARNAQLKHVRKTDGKNDPALDVAEANAKKVLEGEVKLQMPDPCAMADRISYCPYRCRFDRVTWPLVVAV